MVIFCGNGDHGNSCYDNNVVIVIVAMFMGCQMGQKAMDYDEVQIINKIFELFVKNVTYTVYGFLSHLGPHVC